MKLDIENWEKEKERIGEIQPISDIVLLNVGGNKKMEVRKSTLTTVKGSALDALFSGRHELQMRDDRVFIDRDPQAFKMVIEFIRNHGNLNELLQNNMSTFKQELEYWQI